MPKSKRQYTWAKAKPSKVPDFLKHEVTEKAKGLIEKHIRPDHVKPPPKDPKFNYVEDLFTKWHGRYFYFMAKYACSGPNSISPFFEIGFARLEYIGGNRFDLAYFRHTGKWWTIFSAMSLDDALDIVRSDEFFIP